MLSTAIFISVILALKYHKGTGHDILDAEGISFTLYGMINFSRGISGSCLNPAVGIVQSIFTYFMVSKTYEAS
jgi:glycerol uptake facilitator-like aquaporin